MLNPFFLFLLICRSSSTNFIGSIGYSITEGDIDVSLNIFDIQVLQKIIVILKLQFKSSFSFSNFSRACLDSCPLLAKINENCFQSEIFPIFVGFIKRF